MKRKEMNNEMPDLIVHLFRLSRHLSSSKFGTEDTICAENKIRQLYHRLNQLLVSITALRRDPSDLSVCLCVVFRDGMWLIPISVDDEGIGGTALYYSSYVSKVSQATTSLDRHILNTQGVDNHARNQRYE